MDQQIKCLVVEPKTGCYDNVTRFFNENGVSYQYASGDNTIFANLIGSEFPDLDAMAEVFDPVVRAEENEWYFVDGKESLELMGPYKTEHDARVGFCIYISWAGEFVNNARSQSPA